MMYSLLIHTNRLVVGIILVFNLLACRKNSEDHSLIKPVKYEKINFSTGIGERTFSGLSVPASETELSFRVGGVISHVYVSVGDSVKNGQEMARIDNIDDQLELERTKAVLQDMEAQLQTAQANLRRVKRLFEANNVSLSDYERAKSEYAKARADYETTHKTVDLKARQVTYGVLRAPKGGIVIESNYEANEAVSPGDVVMKISGGDSMAVTVGVPENFVGKISKNQPVEIRFSALPGVIYPGEVTLVPYSRPYESAAYQIGVIVDTLDRNIRPGMSAKVTFLLEKSNVSVLIVPSVAVSQDTEGTFVYVIDPIDQYIGVVYRRQIIVGELTGEGYEVKAGLKEGELVVTAGIAKLSEGTKVKLLAPDL